LAQKMADDMKEKFLNGSTETDRVYETEKNEDIDGTSNKPN